MPCARRTVQVLAEVPWFKERILTRVSLGSLIVIILLKASVFNLAKLQVRRWSGQRCWRVHAAAAAAVLSSCAPRGDLVFACALTSRRTTTSPPPASARSPTWRRMPRDCTRTLPSAWCLCYACLCASTPVPRRLSPKCGHSCPTSRLGSRLVRALCPSSLLPGQPRARVRACADVLRATWLPVVAMLLSSRCLRRVCVAPCVLARLRVSVSLDAARGSIKR